VACLSRGIVFQRNLHASEAAVQRIHIYVTSMMTAGIIAMSSIVVRFEMLLSILGIDGTAFLQFPPVITLKQ
jgi:hypothetical protein